jgi:hypothetical protein
LLKLWSVPSAETCSVPSFARFEDLTVFKLLDRFLTVRFRFVEMELGWIPDFLKKNFWAGSARADQTRPIGRGGLGVALETGDALSVIDMHPSHIWKPRTRERYQTDKYQQRDSAPMHHKT